MAEFAATWWRPPVKKRTSLSGCPKLHPHYSRSLSLAVIHKVGCNPNASFADQLACLRAKDGRSLADASKATQNVDWTQVGAQSDSVLLPSASFVGLRPHWKPKPLLLIATSREMREVEDLPLAHMCTHYLASLGYFTAAALEACVARYGAVDAPREILYRDAQHAMNVLLAQWNTPGEAPSFVGLFAQRNHDKHTGDLFYLLGFHRDRFAYTQEDAWMERFYLDAVKRFLRGEQPREDWLPADADGRNFYFLSYANASANQTEERPHFVANGVFNEPAVDFWLHELAVVDAGSRPADSSARRVEPKERSMAEAEEQLALCASWTPAHSKRPHLRRFLRSRLEVIPSPTERIWHPLHNTFLVILALLVSVLAVAVVVMAVDALRNGAFRSRRRPAGGRFVDERAAEADEWSERDADENTILLREARRNHGESSGNLRTEQYSLI
ncbi:hypothetical protein M3Y99_01046300 [Aphelenchoides fujianensis]|nr:hypothetical protein M3Y99_01046300 [Aphelenchoides fujianensis]